MPSHACSSHARKETYDGSVNVSWMPRTKLLMSVNAAMFQANELLPHRSCDLVSNGEDPRGEKVSVHIGPLGSRTILPSMCHRRCWSRLRADLDREQ